MSTSGAGVDTHEMVLMHRVARREFGQLPRLFLQVIPAPARLAYKLIGRRQFTRETTAIRG